MERLKVRICIKFSFSFQWSSLTWFNALDRSYDTLTEFMGVMILCIHNKSFNKNTTYSTPSPHGERENWFIVTDADPPSRDEPTARENQHWLVGNVPGINIEDGETLSDYVGSGPPIGTGLHRYVFLVYQQPGKLTFDEPRLTNV